MTISKVKAVRVWTTSDGSTFDDKSAALKHEAGLSLREWLASLAELGEDVDLAKAIAGDPDGFREAAGALLAKPRKPRVDTGQPRAPRGRPRKAA